MTDTYIIGDIHGHRARLVELLQDERLIGNNLAWIGGGATLCFVGDYVDRGPDGIGVIDLVMSLQVQAEEAGGRVIALIGNHDVCLLSAYRFPDKATNGPMGTFYGDWQINGGMSEDLERLTGEHIEWLVQRPAMVHLDDRLLVHADATFYYQYGDSVEAVNRAFVTLLENDDLAAWDHLLEQFTARRDFLRSDEGKRRAKEFSQRYGGEQIIHGHTPISLLVGRRAESITEPLVYADGLCVNVDGGLYLGGPGFVHRLPQTA